jgi:hypothetical protein
MQQNPVAHTPETLHVPTTNNWWNKIRNYLSQWVHIKVLDRKTPDNSLLLSLAKALGLLKDNQLNAAIECLQDTYATEEITNWREKAKHRQQCNQAIATFGKIMAEINQGEHKQ